jgi:hypothetical protein
MLTAYLFIYLLISCILFTHCRYRELLLHLIALRVLHVRGRTPMDEGSAHQGDLYNTSLTRDRRLCPGGIRTSNPNKRAAAYPRLSPCGHWDWLLTLIVPRSLLTIRDVPTVGRRMSVPRLTAW